MFFFLWYVDHRLNKILRNYIDSEVERVTSLVVSNSLKKVKDDFSSYYKVEKDFDGVEHIYYDTAEIENFKVLLTETVQDEFYKVEHGDFSTYLLSQQVKYREKYPFFQNGYLCEVNMNSINNSTLFGNLGPSIPIRLSFMGFVDSDVSLDVKEYGINNVIVEVGVDMTIKNMITMPITSHIQDTQIHEVISIDVIKGEVPHYYMGRDTV